MTGEPTASRPAGAQSQPESELKYGRALGERLPRSVGEQVDVAQEVAGAGAGALNQVESLVPTERRMPQVSQVR